MWGRLAGISLVVVFSLAVGVGTRQIEDRAVEAEGLLVAEHRRAERLENRVGQLKEYIEEKGLPIPSPSPVPGADPDSIEREQPAEPGAVPSPPSLASPSPTPPITLAPPGPPFEPPPTPTPEVTCIPFDPPIPDFCIEVPETPGP